MFSVYTFIHLPTNKNKELVCNISAVFRELSSILTNIIITLLIFKDFIPCAVTFEKKSTVLVK